MENCTEDSILNLLRNSESNYFIVEIDNNVTKIVCVLCQHNTDKRKQYTTTSISIYSLKKHLQVKLLFPVHFNFISK